MGKRGRKSAASLTIPAPKTDVLVIRRPEAPSYMSDALKREWEMVVRGVSADHFSCSIYPVLEAYCRHAVARRDIDQRIENLDAAATLGDYSRLLGMHERES